ncbi:ABC transporter permease [Paralimibaculum aggregatum]|uniref:ABC transporter permease n=1 Tax=Paralimibaculum aggregatum TaxID=3036245 RepID=A0ABQ6LRK2_9RHOB|nr:ABC transporter permease [Limibaculum sp. NKW23]GMG83800.1 ABC transporter permease [Limibaculum sp. NKW23]
MDRPEHYISEAPYDAATDRQVLERADLDAPTWVLIWRRYRRHRLGVVCLAFLAIGYLLLPFVEIFAPYLPNSFDEDNIYAPPQSLYLFHEGEYVGLHTYPTATVYNVHTGLVERVTDWDRPLPVPVLTTCGEPYTDDLMVNPVLGLFDWNFRVICPPDEGELFLLGSDRLGRDILSRIVYGARLSMTIGLIGVAVSFGIGLVLGGMAGYFGGWIDAAVSRAIEVFRSLPELPIWLALSAAVPISWGPITVFLMISVILGLLDWPGLARAVRSKFLALREEDYVRAAELMGASPARVIGRHMMPNFMSHLIASASLSIPAMILGETALSFLGLGLRPPAVSWGMMLNDALNLTAVEIYPWLLWPMVPVILGVLAFSFVGDALRDAMDPYS